MAPDTATKSLLRLCVGYFLFYVVTGVAVKYFQGSPSAGLPGLTGMQYLVYSTIGGNLLCLALVTVLGWWRAGGVPRGVELALIAVSGACTAVVVPSTTLLYSLPISVMVAMVIMRGSIIVISRLVDAVQIRQGLLTRPVQPEENVAVGFALAAVATHLVLADADGFAFLSDPTAVTVLGSYIAAYAVRIYLMNWFKNTAGTRTKTDNRTFFAWEQLFSSIVLTAVVSVLVVEGPSHPAFAGVRDAMFAPHPMARWAVLAGGAFGVVAFFSVFIFLFRGRSATFVGLVNRLVSLVAGTAATLISAWLLGGKWPQLVDWVSLGFIFLAVAFLARAERRTNLQKAGSPAIRPVAPVLVAKPA
jgi:hypothetical protein